MTISLTSRGTEGELLLDGRLDANTSLEVEPIFEDVCERFDRVILNMAGLDYVSSAGLRIIKRFHINMVKKEGELILTNVSHVVMEVFEMTGFVSLLNIR